MINSHCYNFESKTYKNGFLDSFVDATYILTMTNSKRRDNINMQLHNYIPTKKIFIVNNEGYKNCDKILIEQIPPYDLTDAYFNAISHSIKNNFNNILILEDDFIFNDKIKDKDIINKLKLFFDKNKDNKFYFNLGPTPIIFYPNINLFNPIFKGIYCGCSQAIIYNKKTQYDILYKINKDIKHWDTFLMKTYNNYFYEIPLCYQTFPQTENQKYWYSSDNNMWYIKILNNLIFKINKLLKLDVQPEPGYSIIYRTFFIINYIVFMFIFIFIILILTIYFYIVQNKNILLK